MLVYLMGLADIFAAIMLLTGLRPSIIMPYVVAVLLIKGVTSFWNNLNPTLYVLGAADIIAIFMLWNGVFSGNVGIVLVGLMAFKGFISFWQLDALRNGTFLTVYTIFSVLTFGLVKLKDKTKTKKKFKDFFWVGSNKKKFERYSVPEINYPKENKNTYPYLQNLK